MSKQFSSIKETIGRKNEEYLPEILRKEKKLLKKTTNVGLDEGDETDSDIEKQ